MTERKNAVTFKGNPMTLVGPEIKVGDIAPEFKAVGCDMADIALTAFKGRVVVLSVAPSVDTPVCATQTRTFNKAASDLSDDVTILSISMDLPFALGRFCGAEGIKQVKTASDYKYRAFGETYGIYLKELGLLGRGVFVIGRDGKVRHVEYVREVTSEPNYAAALDAARAAL